MESQTQPSTSNFFTILPAEMRNMIYALAFTPADREMDKKTDLLKAVPPNRELLLVSRQTYIEAWIHYQKANGKMSPKVFKWKTFELGPTEKVKLTKTHVLRAVTTRVHYEGAHILAIHINGEPIKSVKWNLTL
ncbi:MAG: hypothetical protein EOP06_08710 [Proteobacteria bacterium]|nr:MAG: hypothetical protein EOP06_08710 [Pseudomonadota bacterium]